jgi:glucose/arabinose dehydrogenase
MLGLALASGVPVLAQPGVYPRQFRLEELQTQPGYQVSIYAGVPGAPRLMAAGPNGALYVAAGDAVWAIPAAGQTVRAIDGLSGAHSVQFVGNDLYVAVADGVLRFPNAITDDFVIRTPGERLLSLPAGGQHITRTAYVGPDGRIYVTAGSTCNFCIENDPRRAAAMRFEADGSGQAIFARGLRNSVGLAWHPATAELWATDNGGDGLGDDVPPDEINILKEGSDYGWPDCYGSQIPVDWGAQARLDRCGSTVPPELALQAHSAPLGIAFYTGAQYPGSFVNDALVAFHGSWNRNEPTGYKVVRVRAAGGHATGIEDFLWGFLDLNTRTTSGRPVHAIPGADGAVYISDDLTGNIYRVAYVGPRLNPGGFVQRAPGIYELYGENLANDPAQFGIYAAGVLLETLYVSSNQVNFLLPDRFTGDVTITVKNEKGTDEATLHVDGR